MTYDPSNRSQPPRQERWPEATPAEPWPAYREDGSYPYGGLAAADGQSSHRATAGVGSRRQAGDADAARGAADPRYSGYHPSRALDPLPTDQGRWDRNNWDGRDWDGNSYPDAETSDYGTQADYATQAGYSSQPGYATQAGYATQTGYGDGFDGAPVSQDHGTARSGYVDAAQGHDGTPDGYGTPDEYGGQDEFPDASGYAGSRHNFDGAPDPAGSSYGYYRDPDDLTGAQRAPAGTVLTAPDADVYPEGWRTDRDNRRESRRRGLLVGAMTGFLATATASAVSILAAAFVRPQASPILAVYDVFSDRMPAVLRDFTAHFGTHGRTMLLLGLYISVAVLGLVIGMLARRAAALGVAGLAALSVLGAFVTITRPQGQVIDVLPAMAGGLAGVLALLWLRRASAPIVALRPAPGNEPRRAR
jgi:uncharacterized membrane protein YhaH (DUF805 family)